MRITTRMLDEAAIKAGMPINRNSLLNYVNHNSMDNTLLSALNNKKTNALDKNKKSKYEKLDTAADQLLQKTKAFTDKERDSLFAKAKESGKKTEICTNAKEMAEKYNETIQALQGSNDFLGQYYKKELLQAASQQVDKLEKIGITVEKDGTLQVDSKKMEEADIDTLEQVLGKEGSFSSRVEFLAEKIGDHASANVAAVSSQYNAQGDISSDFLGRYNFFG